MTITELQKIIEDKNNSSASLTKQLRDLQSEISKLRNQLYVLEMETFVNYLQLDETIEFDNYYSFKGFSKDPKSTNSFIAGERIKVVKKNKKSIVVEVVKKNQRKWDETQKKSITIGQINPGWIIRVDLESFFHFYFKNKTQKAAFDSYVKRKQALDNLLSE
jgi:TolA-binding protein